MALVQRRRLGKSTAELKKLLDNYKPDAPQAVSFRINDYRPGPGSELKKLLAWFARPSDACQCETRADTMNDWGVEGCRENLDTILDWLMEEAQLRKLPHGRFTRAIARSLVLTAIRRLERKYPDGPPEPADRQLGGCRPAATHNARTLTTWARFILSKLTVALPLSVSPTITVPSTVQSKCSAQSSCCG